MKFMDRIKKSRELRATQYNAPIVDRGKVTSQSERDFFKACAMYSAGASYFDIVIETGVWMG